MNQVNKGFQSGVKQLQRPRRHVAPASMPVTVALEEARKRGFLHRDDMSGLNTRDRNDYIELARRELNLTTWDDSPQRRS